MKVAHPYFERASRRRRGRPRKNAAPIGPTETKSIRLPAKAWEQFDARARREKKSRHEAMREAMLIWLQS